MEEVQKQENVFDSRNTLKKILHKNARSDNKFCHPGEIWWASLGVNMGKEQDGDVYHETFNRLVLILSTYGEKSDIVLVLSITKNEQKEYFGYCLPKFKYSYFKYEYNYIIYTQIRAISKKRLHKEVGAISKADFEDVIEGFNKILIKKKKVQVPSLHHEGNKECDTTKGND